MRRFTPLLIATALLGAAPAALPAAVWAQTGAPARIPPGARLAEVKVTLGPELQRMADRYGERELRDLADVLQRRIAIDAGRSGFVRADLILEDARPNRPTLQQQSRNVGLSFQSISLGGAAITGQITRADGSTQPLTFSYFETDLSQDRGATTWYDANRAFDYLGGQLRRGDVPHRYGAGGAPRRYDCRSFNDAFCSGA